MNLTVVQFNTLADNLAVDFPLCPPEYLKWDYRKNLILQKILNAHARIIALQEVDHFDDFFKNEMKEYFYEGLFVKKANSNDGCVVFYHKSLSLIRHQFIEYPNMNQRGIYCEFQLNDFAFAFVTTHFKAKLPFQDQRLIQADFLLKTIKLFNEKSLPCIIALDMNDTPDSPVYDKFIKEDFVSTYQNVDFTTFKVRKDGEFCRVIDYIFCKGLTDYSTYELPTKEMIGSNGLPSKYHPSDHLMLITYFAKD